MTADDRSFTIYVHAIIINERSNEQNERIDKYVRKQTQRVRTSIYHIYCCKDCDEANCETNDEEKKIKKKKREKKARRRRAATCS